MPWVARHKAYCALATHKNREEGLTDCLPALQWRGRIANIKGLSMCSTMATSVLHSSLSKLITTTICACTLFAGLVVVVTPASALVTGAGYSLQDQLKQNSSVIEVAARRGGAVRRTTVSGPRGGTASRTVARRGAVAGVRPVARPGGWVRPAHYTWRPGGAIAAGAAIGMVTAATAAAWAGSPPAPGYCWYYTDPSRTQGFWDVCQ